VSLYVNYNSSAFEAHLNLQRTDMAQQSSIEKLSSGLKINSAADGPAGLVISQQMTSQAQGMGQAINNANDGINLVKTAEGALNETQNLLMQMRNLAVHAANAGANSTGAVAADQAALDNAVQSIDRIASTTRFNGKQLLDGSFSNQTFQIGANASDTVSLSVSSQDATTLAVGSLNLSTSAGAAITAIDAAISAVSDTRSTLGSFQTNTLQTTVNSLQVAQQNIQGAQATIADVDIAAETVAFTRNNIVMQAGVSMLAQANQEPQAVLKLLQ